MILKSIIKLFIAYINKTYIKSFCTKKDNKYQALKENFYFRAKKKMKIYFDFLPKFDGLIRLAKTLISKKINEKIFSLLLKVHKLSS